MQQIILILALLTFLLVTGYLGFLGFRKTRTPTDYLLAGREAHPYIMAMSYGATFISTAAIVGFGGAAGVFGLSLLWLTFLNIFVGIFIAFVFFGHRTRAMGYNLDSHTLPELLGKRFNSRFIQVFSGLMVFLFMPIYAAAVMMGASQFLVVNLNIGYEMALFMFSAVVALYVIMGGLKGVMYADALQGSVMFLGMIFLLIFTYSNLGGMTSAHQSLSELTPQAVETFGAGGHMGFTSMPALGSNLWWVVVSTIILGVGIGVLAQPQLAVRFMTVRSSRELNRATLVGGIFIFMMTGVAFLVGALSNVHFMREGGVLSVAAAGGNVDAIIPTFIEQTTPAWFGIIFVVALFAAAMSTMSSQFHVMGTALSRDVAETTLRRKPTLGLSRFGTSVAIILSTFIAWGLPRFYDAGSAVIARGTAIFFGLCAAALLPMFIAALYWKRATRTGAIAGMVAGFSATVLWFLFVHEAEARVFGIVRAFTGRDTLWGFPWTVVNPIIVALPLAAIVTYTVSLLTAPMKEKHLKECFNGLSGKREELEEEKGETPEPVTAK